MNAITYKLPITMRGNHNIINDIQNSMFLKINRNSSNGPPRVEIKIQHVLDHRVDYKVSLKENRAYYRFYHHLPAYITENKPPLTMRALGL